MMRNGTELSGQTSACGHRCWIICKPIISDPAVMRLPRATTPEHAANIEIVIEAAINCSPEVDIASTTIFIPLPVFRNELRVIQEVVEDGNVEHWFLRKFLANHDTDDGAVLLTLHDLQDDLLAVEVEAVGLFLETRSTSTIVLLDLCSEERKPRRLRAVEHMFDATDLGETTLNVVHPS